MTIPIDEDNSIEFQPTRFNIDLGLPEANSQLLNEAAASLRQEFRSSSKWKRLRCRKLSVFAERDRGTIYVVHIGRSVDFDWTWETAKEMRIWATYANRSLHKRLRELVESAWIALHSFPANLTYDL